MGVGNASFFRFAEGRGWCRRGLADAVKTPPLYRHEGLPLGPSWDDVNRLLAVAQSDCPVDIRDRALLLLLAVYGLRAGEVAALRLDDFDWEREVLTVPHGKRQRPRIYPLCRTVGDAILRYLRKARPRSDRREVFITVLAPFRALHSKSVGGMVSRRLHSLGLTLPHYGAHTLRHALRHASAGAGPVTKGDWRPSRTPVAGGNPHLCQGRSGRTAHGRRLHAGGPAMNLHDLVTSYVDFRRTLGEKCLTNEAILRSFCRSRRAANTDQPDSR